MERLTYFEKTVFSNIEIHEKLDIIADIEAKIDNTVKMILKMRTQM